MRRKTCRMMMQTDFDISALPTRHLEDFFPLSAAESVILARLAAGSVDQIGDGNKPDAGSRERVVRAEFLRFLLLGGSEGHRPHEKGIQLKGALITGVLDLQGCRVPRGITLLDCHLENAPIAHSTRLDELVLDGSTMPGLEAEGVEVRGGISLVGATVEGSIVLYGSNLGGRLNCDGASIVARGNKALAADAIVARSVVLRGAKISGSVALVGAKLTSDLNLAGTTLACPEGVALNADGADVDGDIVLHASHISGEVHMVGTHVAGDLDCSGAILHNPGQVALKINRAVIMGGFFLWRGARVKGVLDMTGASVNSLHDDLSSWPERGDLLLNRCLYEAFIGGPTEAARRLEWLSRQTPARWGEDFWPQPYEQLATVYRNMGHEDDARTVLIAKEKLQRRARRARSGRAMRLILAAKDGVLGATVRYGRQPLWAFFWLLLFWAVGVAVFGFGESRGAFKPTSVVIMRSPEWLLCGFDSTQERMLLANQQVGRGRAEPGQTQLDCYRSQIEASSYPRFNPWMYSLDVLIPVVEIDQKSYWRPDQTKPWGRMTAAYFYVQSIFGWVLGLLAIAGFSGLVKSR